jgi:hypothetical protein
MVYRGIVKGKVIEFDQTLPFREGQSVSVSVAVSGENGQSVAARIIEAMRTPPHLDPRDVDEMERAIEEGSVPVRDAGIFDNEIE